MAVYTHITAPELSAFLEGYDLGTLVSFEGIAQGVSNTNYHVFTDKGRYILTLFEERRVKAEDLPFFFAFSEHLSQKGIQTPRALPDQQGRSFGTLANRAATFLSFLQGKDIPKAELTADHCGSFGEGLARMHRAAEGFSMTRKNSMGPERWKALAEKTESGADRFRDGLRQVVADELEALLSAWPDMDRSPVPVGTIHADMFPDNIFFVDGKMSAVIDFYFSCTDFYAYDLAISINAWCFDMQHGFSPKRYEAMMDSYHSVRPLSEEEKRMLPLFCRGAALRILLSRLEEFLEHDPENTLMIPHDPGEYLTKLQFHQKEGLPGV
ncbi:MAG: homoserine kinase [Alphaproteobacteria bacterium]|nr:homoserine kinase [Alphaproteobacteria bacterium]